MPPQRGKIHNLTFATQKIDKAISGLNGECFTPKEIHEIIGVNRLLVHVIICAKTKKGLLQRIRRGCYRGIPGINLTINHPSAFVATKAWEVLSQSEKPLTHREISEIIEKKTGLNLYFSIGVLLFNWYRKKVLDKIGGKQPYQYQIKPGYSKSKGRPIATRPIIA